MENKKPLNEQPLEDVVGGQTVMPVIFADNPDADKNPDSLLQSKNDFLQNSPKENGN